MSANTAAPTEPELSEEQIEKAKEAKRQMEEIKETAPRYDVEYHVNDTGRSGPLDDSDEKAVMTAHGMLNSDLDGQAHVPINTTIDREHSPEGVISVMITVAVNAKRHTFEDGKAKAAWLADPRSKHWLWCCKPFETKDERETRNFYNER